MFCGAALVGTTYAWNNISQTAVNEFTEEPDTIPVELLKLEKRVDGTLTENPLSGVLFYLYKEDGTRIGGIYTTDELGKIVVSLPMGDYYFEEIAPKDGYDYDRNEDGTEIRKYWFTVSEEKEKIEIHVYNVRKTGTLTIEKWVQNADDSDLTEDQFVQEFSFKVTFSDGGTYSYRIDGGELQSVASGECIFLRHGQKAMFEGIPTGVVYTVTEVLPTLEHGQYLIGSEYHHGTITEVGSIARFTNTYWEDVLEPLPVKIKVTKEVVGAVPTEDKDKVFDMTIDINGTQTDFSLKDGESMEFDAATGDIYEVTEKDYSEEGYVQEIIGGMGTAIGDTEVLVRNRYGKEIRKDIYVEKIWNLNGVSSNVLPKSITVQLKQGDLVIDEKIITPNAEGVWSITFNAPKYDADGNEIFYTVVELPIEGFQTSYDTSRSEEGIYYVVNTMLNPIQSTLPILEKQVIGDGAPRIRFEFWLKGEDGAPMPEGSVDQTKIVTMNQSGAVELGSVSFTKAGEYRYTITEVNGEQEGWTYDASVYTLIVQVSETESGFVAEQTILKDGNWTDRILFQNAYSEKEKPVDTPEKPIPEDPDSTKPDSPDKDGPDENPPDGGESDRTDQTAGAVSQTGDTTSVVKYLLLCIISGMLLAAGIIYQNRHLDRNNRKYRRF